MLPKLKHEIDRAIANQLAARPVRSPGSQTSVTTRGVIRRVKVTQSTGAPAKPADKPRWG
jgi:hypothetical protein